MNPSDVFEKAARLDAIGREIGLVLWDLQDVEWMLAQYAVLAQPDVRGIGMDAAAPVIVKWEKKTFGVLVRGLSEAGHIDDRLTARLRAIVDERNWIVHRSKNDNRGVINSPERFATLLARLGRARDEAADLRRELLALITDVANSARVSAAFVDREAARLLRAWGFVELAEQNGSQ